MLGKAKGQVLRVAASLYVLFGDTIDGNGDITVSNIPSTISKEAIIAAMNYVNTCCQHAAFIAGHGKIKDEISQVTSGNIQC